MKNYVHSFALGLTQSKLEDIRKNCLKITKRIFRNLQCESGQKESGKCGKKENAKEMRKNGQIDIQPDTIIKETIYRD